MAAEEELAARLRAMLAGREAVHEIKMFGGLCFTLNGNMVAAASRRGLLLRVGKEQHAAALTLPNARAMEMRGRKLEGYVVIDPPPGDEAGLREWLDLAVGFVETLPPKAKKPRRR